MGLGKKKDKSDKVAIGASDIAKVALVAAATEDDGAGPAVPAPTAATEVEKRTPKQKIVGAFDGLLSKLDRVGFAFGHYDRREDSDDEPNLAKMITEARGWLGNALDFAKGLDDGFTPPRKPRGPGAPRKPALTVAVGDVVSIKPKALKNYLEDGETELPGGNKITIVKLSNDVAVRAKFGDGLVTLVKRNHLCALIK